MKKIIITLSSIATLAISANAQTIWSDLMNPDGTSSGAFFLGGTNSITASISGADFRGFVASPVFGNEEGFSIAGNGSIFLNISFSGPQWSSEDITGDIFSLSGKAGATEAQTYSGLVQLIADANAAVTGNTITGSTGLVSSVQGTGSYTYAPGTSGFNVTLNNNDPETLTQFLSVPSVVPEPSSTALLGLSALGLLARRRR